MDQDHDRKGGLLFNGSGESLVNSNGEEDDDNYDHNHGNGIDFSIRSSKVHSDEDDDNRITTSNEDENLHHHSENSNNNEKQLKEFHAFLRSILYDNLNKTSEKFENIEEIIEECRKKYPEFEDKIKKRIKMYIKEYKTASQHDNDMSVSSRSTPSPYYNHTITMPIDKLASGNGDSPKTQNSSQKLFTPHNMTSSNHKSHDNLQRNKQQQQQQAVTKNASSFSDDSKNAKKPKFNSSANSSNSSISSTNYKNNDNTQRPNSIGIPMSSSPLPTSNNNNNGINSNNAAAAAFAASLAAAAASSASALDADFFRLAAAASNPFQFTDFSRVAAAAAAANPYFNSSFFRPTSAAASTSPTSSTATTTNFHSPFLTPTLPPPALSASSYNHSQSNGTSRSDSNSPVSNNNHSSKLKSIKLGQLTSTDIESIKNLINSYKESASFLYRSAEELEQLVNSQQYDS